MVNEKRQARISPRLPLLPERCRYVRGAHLCGARYPTTLQISEYFLDFDEKIPKKFPKKFKFRKNLKKIFLGLRKIFLMILKFFFHECEIFF